MSAQIASRQAERPPLGPVLRNAFLAALITAALCWWAAATAPLSVRTPLAWGAGAAALALSAAVALTTHARGMARHHRQQARALAMSADDLAYRALPELVAVLREGTSADRALARFPESPVPAFREITRTLATEVGRGERMRAAALTACGNAAARVQALATTALADLREMENRADEDTLGDLLHLDHLTSQTGRLADSIAVITGSRTGRRWNKPIVMESILRGAMGRISSYRRVRLHNTCTRAVAGHAAEGVMHALAEIMDNAATFSPPTAEVHVYVEETRSGVIVTVEDSGLVMGERQLAQAEESVSAKKLDFMTMSGSRLGLTVVGCLARKHRLKVSFRPSARGGTGVVVMIPQPLITDPPRDKRFYEDLPEEAEQRPVAGRDTSTALPQRSPASPATHTPAAPPAHSSPREPESRPAQEHPAPARQRPYTAPAAGAPAAGAPAADAPAGGSGAPGGGTGEAQRFGASGLPMRRRGQTLASAPGPTAGTAAPAPRRPARSKEENAARFAAFRKAVTGDTDGRGVAYPGPDHAGRERGDQPDGAAASSFSPFDNPPARPEDDPR